jgi:hypothetical protein
MTAGILDFVDAMMDNRFFSRKAQAAVYEKKYERPLP